MVSADTEGRYPRSR